MFEALWLWAYMLLEARKQRLQETQILLEIYILGCILHFALSNPQFLLMDHEDRLKIINSILFVFPQQIEEELKGHFQGKQHERLLEFLKGCNTGNVRRKFEMTERDAWKAFVKGRIDDAIKSLGIERLPRQYRVTTQKFDMNRFFVPCGFGVRQVCQILLSVMFKGFTNVCDYPLDYTLNRKHISLNEYVNLLVGHCVSHRNTNEYNQAILLMVGSLFFNAHRQRSVKKGGHIDVINRLITSLMVINLRYVPSKYRHVWVHVCAAIRESADAIGIEYTVYSFAVPNFDTYRTDMFFDMYGNMRSHVIDGVWDMNFRNLFPGYIDGPCMQNPILLENSL